MRHHDPAAVFPKAECAAPCGKPWAKWCRGCNLVYCETHADMTIHGCKRLDLRRDIGAPAAPPKQRRAKSAPEKPPPSPIQGELPLNGKHATKPRGV